MSQGSQEGRDRYIATAFFAYFYFTASSISHGFYSWQDHMSYVFMFLMIALLPCTLADVVVPTWFVYIRRKGDGNCVKNIVLRESPRRDGEPVLHNLNLDSGEFFVGSGGCGKTTILRILAGLESADAGTLYLDDQDITGSVQTENPYRISGMLFFRT